MRLRFSPRAQADLDAIDRYIRKESPRGAERIMRRIHRRLHVLIEFPLQGRPGARPETHELVIAQTPYVATYAVLATEIVIIAIRHGARRPLKPADD